jgi:hypothetical protein
VRRGRSVVALTVIVVSLGLVGLLDVLVEPTVEPDPTPVALAGSDAVSGRTVCAVGDARAGTSADVDAVRPGQAGDPPAVAEMRTLAGGTSEPLLTSRLFPGAAARATIEAGPEEDAEDDADADADATDGDATGEDEGGEDEAADADDGAADADGDAADADGDAADADGDAADADGDAADADGDAADADGAAGEDDVDATEDDDEDAELSGAGEIAASIGVATDVRWSGAPVTVARSWRLEGGDDLPAGTAAGPCAPGTAATRWLIPGLATDGGNEALLRLANPHGTGATVAVTFLTPEGPDDPTRLRNISVGPDETIELSLNDFLPEQPDLAVAVEVLSGRVAAEGVQLARSAIGGVDGVSLLQAAVEPAEAWTIPWVVDGEDRASWLWVANHTDRSAPVELTLHTEDGGVVPEGLAELAVPPGTVRRVDLRGTFPEGVGTAAVTARSEGVPVTVSGVAQLTASDPADTGVAVQLGAAADAVWTLTGSGREGRNEQLRLVNPGSEPATVDVTLWNGSNATTPAELAGLEVPAGSLTVVPLTGLVQQAASWALTVRASSGEVVAGTVSSGDPDGPRHLVAAIGAPSSWWQTPRAPILRSAPGTTQRLGTELGIEPIDPLTPADDADAGTSPVTGDGVETGTAPGDDAGPAPDEGADG